MGISIILIMLFHCGVLPFGSIGVDFFLFISGFGMYHSLSKSNDAKSFYIRRADRILPMYIIVAIPYFIYNSSGVTEFLLRISNIAVVTDGYLNGWWFIGEILVCYLVSPLLYKLFHKGRMYGWITLTSVSIICYSIGYLVPNTYIMAYRIPSYLLGFMVSYNYANNHRKDNLRLMWAMILLVADSLSLSIIFSKFRLLWENKEAVYSIASYPMVLFLAVLTSVQTKYVGRILSFLGTITLELYLTHEYFAKPLSQFLLGGGKTWLFVGTGDIINVHRHYNGNDLAIIHQEISQ